MRSWTPWSFLATGWSSGPYVLLRKINPLFKGLAEVLVENGREHHRILAELIAKYKE